MMCTAEGQTALLIASRTIKSAVQEIGDGSLLRENVTNRLRRQEDRAGDIKSPGRYPPQRIRFRDAWEKKSRHECAILTHFAGFLSAGSAPNEVHGHDPVPA